MKKMILGLALCLGISQVVVAQKEETRGLTEDSKGIMTWIKNNPKKVALIALSVAGSAYTISKIAQFDGKDGKWAKVKGGTKEASYNIFVNPFVVAKDKTVAGSDAIWANMKNHKKLWIGVPAGVVAVIAAAVIAEYTADEDSYLKVTNLWNKLCKKAATEEVVA